MFSSDEFPAFGHLDKPAMVARNISRNSAAEQGQAGSEDIVQVIISRGEMVKVLRGTFTQDCFVVEHKYQGLRAEIVRKKQQIVRENIHLLLDYYEKVLELRPPPEIAMKSVLKD